MVVSIYNPTKIFPTPPPRPRPTPPGMPSIGGGPSRPSRPTGSWSPPPGMPSIGGGPPRPTTGNIENQGPEPIPVRNIPREPTIRDWRDATYNLQIARINRALQDFETGATTRGERYGQDYMTGLSRLGYRPGTGFVAMPNIVEALPAQAAASTATADGETPAQPAVDLPAISGMFDIEGQFDRTAAAARGTRNLRDEFAARGGLRSSDFANTFADFQNRLGQQLQAMEQGRTRFGEDLAREITQQRTQAEEQRQAAEEAARQRAIMESLMAAGFYG